jgi:hypothetical protein
MPQEYDLEKTKVVFTKKDLEIVIKSLEEKIVDKNADIEFSKESYQEFKEDNMLLNRLKRAGVRLGTEVTICKILTQEEYKKVYGISEPDKA